MMGSMSTSRSPAGWHSVTGFGNATLFGSLHHGRREPLMHHTCGWIAVVALLSTALGCGSSEDETAGNAKLDAASDTAGDQAADATEDTEYDTTRSDGPGPDGSWPDGGPDVQEDGAQDAPADTSQDVAQESAPDAGAPMYLVSIDHQASPSRLLKVSLATGMGTVVCNLPAGVDAVNYHSTTFSREGKLYASNYEDATLDLIDPCTCEVTVIGPTGVGAIPGITANKTLGLYGMDTTNDTLVDVSVFTGAATVIGSLGADFTTAGATWSDALEAGSGGLFGLNGATSQLYEIDATTGLATATQTVTGVSIGSVGIELHPFDGSLYVCTNDAILYRVDPGTGVAVAVGAGMGHVGPCNNLAAPWKVVSCLAD